VIVVDLLRNSLEAEALATHVEVSGKKLEAILITHGHPDHYIGLGVFHRRFPGVPVRVASAEIRDDIISFSRWMDSVGWLEAEPAMKVKSEKDPDGFDYAGVIQVLDQPVLTLPSAPTSIRVRSDYPGSECGHMTTLCIPEQRVFLGFDLLYSRVHAWCGPGVGKDEIRAWIHTLDAIQEQTGEGEWTFYCGHGGEGNRNVVREMKAYLQTFVDVTSVAESRRTAIERMKELFPGYAQDDFLLVFSVNFHVQGNPDTSPMAT
jgi:glyoxylase-like metal-dependent hydrolase (beta-lactamase superfamily II)